MIVSVNTKPSLDEFKELMRRTDILLNEDAIRQHSYYVTRGGSLLEDDVKNALEECAKGTPFENTIEKVSGQKFPDIVAAKFYGVEVKSTKENHWKSTGSSILETTRLTDVERIYMTFGKLGGNPIEFLSKPYEECLYGIAVTHMPRYLINMQLHDGETIFDKIGIPYDELRKMDNPIVPVSKYYRSKLKPGESLWWAGDSVDETVSAIIKVFDKVDLEDKRKYTTYACVNFPEVFGGNYERYALWLMSKSIVDYHIRDQFSAGGQEPMQMPDGSYIKFPAVYRRVKRNINYFLYLMRTQGQPVDMIQDNEFELRKRLLDWSSIVSDFSSMDYNVSMDALSMLFFGTSYEDAKAVLNNQERVITSGYEISKCSKCGKCYRQTKLKQMEGHRIKEKDICPYCNNINRESMEWEFINIRL